MNKRKSDNNKYTFIFEKENGQQVNCELLFNFYVKDNDKNYMVFTDNTFDKNNNLMIYAYYTIGTTDTLNPVIDDSEYMMINEVYKTILQKVV